MKRKHTAKRFAHMNVYESIGAFNLNQAKIFVNLSDSFHTWNKLGDLQCIGECGISAVYHLSPIPSIDKFTDQTFFSIFV